MLLVKIKSEMQFNGELTRLVAIMRDISIAQYHLLEKRKDSYKKFVKVLNGFFKTIDFVKTEHPLVKGNPDAPTGIIIVTSDLGFMGGLNTKIISVALEKYNLEYKRNVKFCPELIIIGQKGAAYLKDLGYKFKFFPGISIEKEENIARISALRDYLVEQVIKARLGSVVLFYPKPLLFVVQQVEMVKLIPFTELFKREEKTASGEGAPILESSLNHIAEYLAALWLEHLLYDIFEESKLSEFAARAMYLEGSYQELEHTNIDLRFKYFRACHELVDKNMRETFAANILIGHD